MPLFEYTCADCGGRLELFQQPTDPSPRICGYRCVLAADDPREIRGQGSLERAMSRVAGHRQGYQMRDVPNAADLERAGITTIQKDDAGRRELGTPDKLDDL